MDSTLRPEQAYQIRQKCFSKFEELIGFYPKSLKQRILALLIYNFDWWAMHSMVMVLNETTSISQRIGDMARERIEFKRRMITPQHFEWSLKTSLDQIDFSTCKLKVQPPSAQTIGVDPSHGSMPERVLHILDRFSTPPADSQAQSRVGTGIILAGPKGDKKSGQQDVGSRVKNTLESIKENFRWAPDSSTQPKNSNSESACGSTEQNACASLINIETGGRPVTLSDSRIQAGSKNSKPRKPVARFSPTPQRKTSLLPACINLKQERLKL